MKSLYVLQPYLVGSNRAKSLALIIPAPVRREANISESTVFLLKIDQKTKKIILHSVNEKYGNVIPAEKSFEPSKRVPMEIP